MHRLFIDKRVFSLISELLAPGMNVANKYASQVRFVSCDKEGDSPEK